MTAVGSGESIVLSRTDNRGAVVVVADTGGGAAEGAVEDDVPLDFDEAAGALIPGSTTVKWMQQKQGPGGAGDRLLSDGSIRDESRVGAMGGWAVGLWCRCAAYEADRSLRCAKGYRNSTVILAVSFHCNFRPTALIRHSRQQHISSQLSTTSHSHSHTSIQHPLSHFLVTAAITRHSLASQSALSSAATTYAMPCLSFPSHVHTHFPLISAAAPSLFDTL